MHIAHLSTFGSGGASIAAQRIHISLVKNNYDSFFYYYKNGSNIINSVQYKRNKIVEKIVWKIYWNKYKKFFKNRKKESVFSTPGVPTGTRFSMFHKPPDIIHLHFISYFVDFVSFVESCPTTIPIVWTLHDANALTGGCHYPGYCEKFKDICNACPQLNPNVKSDLAYKNFTKKNCSTK